MLPLNGPHNLRVTNDQPLASSSVYLLTGSRVKAKTHEMNTLKLLCTCRLLRIFTGSKFDPISGVYDGHAVISSSVVFVSAPECRDIVLEA